MQNSCQILDEQKWRISMARISEKRKDDVNLYTQIKGIDLSIGYFSGTLSYIRSEGILKYLSLQREASTIITNGASQRLLS